jgi:glycosyltransferase involved in cell wall biosynthesis
MLNETISILRDFFKQMQHQACIVFLGGYPCPSRLGDGYYQRINSINQQFTGFLQIHIDRKYLPITHHWLSRPEKDVLTISIRHHWAGRLVAILSILFTKKLYIHSIFPLKNLLPLLRLPKIIKVIDFHGVVPEEHLMKNDPVSASRFEKLEKFAIEKADHYIFVSEAMANHFKRKYIKSFKTRYTVIPIVPNLTSELPNKPPLSEKPVVIYAGGLQDWQMIPEMIKAIGKTASDYQFKIFTPQPDEIKSILSKNGVTQSKLEIDSKPHRELLAIYPRCHFGFVLRDDNVVNQVACPTKLIEYLAFGVIPILNYANIGDFIAMGMQFISLEDFITKNIPDQMCINDMVQKNFDVYQLLLKKFQQGVQILHNVLLDKNQKT